MMGHKIYGGEGRTEDMGLLKEEVEGWTAGTDKVEVGHVDVSWRLSSEGEEQTALFHQAELFLARKA